MHRKKRELQGLYLNIKIHEFTIVLSGAVKREVLKYTVGESCLYSTFQVKNGGQRNSVFPPNILHSRWNAELSLTMAHSTP